MDELNINDIARKLGLAKSTVSKALNNRFDVSEKTKERVRRLVGELHYAPNHCARTLKSRRSKLVGIVMPDDVKEDFFAQLVRGLTGALAERGYATVFASSEKAGEKAAIREQISRRVDGFILFPCFELDVQFINDIIGQGYKLVTVDNYVEGIDAPFVGTDFARGAYLAVKHLLDSGHRRIGHLGGPERVASTGERIDGHRKAYREAGVEFPESLIVNCEYDEADAKDKFIRLRKDHPGMTALHCAGLMMTKGALAGMRELGLSVPQDISLVDFGSSTFISSLDQKAGELSQTAVKALLELIDGGAVPSRSIINPTLVIRNSTRLLKDTP